MTISRKEFDHYAEVLGEIAKCAKDSHDLHFWQVGQRKWLAAKITEEAGYLRQALEYRISKPRKKLAPTP